MAPQVCALRHTPDRRSLRLLNHACLRQRIPHEISGAYIHRIQSRNPLEPLLHPVQPRNRARLSGLSAPKPLPRR